MKVSSGESWTAVETEHGARYEHTTLPVEVVAAQTETGGTSIRVAQQVRVDGYETTIVTFGTSARGDEAVESRVSRILSEVDAGQHLVDPIAAVAHEDYSMIDFVIVYTDEISGLSVSMMDYLRDIVDAYIRSGRDVDIVAADLDLDAPDASTQPETMALDICPRPMHRVESVSDRDVGT